MRNICLLLAASLLVSTAASAQTVTFDFEVDSLADLEAAGWVFIDEQPIGVDPVITYPDTITLTTEIVHGGSKALRMRMRDLAYFNTNGQFGTLDLWVYDFGYQIHNYVSSSIYGHTFGLRKFSADGYGYGIGGGLVDKTNVDSDGGYGVEWGLTEHLDIAEMNNGTFEEPNANAGWSGDQSWWSCYWLGYLPNGRPYTVDGESGWNHWRISYLESGVVTIQIVESWAGDARAATPPENAPGHSFDGTMAGGVDDIFLYGGRTGYPGLEPEPYYGDAIFDDITWTPVGGPACIPGDADCDGDVDLDDFVALKVGFGSGTTWAEGDFDEDGDVDLDDFVILKTNFGATAG